MESEEAVYRVKDNLQYFFIQVELRRVTTTRNIGHVLGETGQLLSSSTRQSSIGLGTSTNQQEYEKLTYSWQHKYFSQREEELYADGNNCCTALESRYHHQILALRNEGGRPNQRLYCYTDVDSLPISEEFQPIIVGGAELPTFASQQSGLRRRRQHRTATTSSLSPVCDKPTERERASNRMTTASSQSMYLMADLRHLDGVDEEDEHVLCHITVHSDGVMTLKPDVTKNRPWYRLENRHREIYEYRLVHVSEGMTQGERRKEWRLKNELIQRHASHIESSVGQAYTEPPADEALRVAVYGNIESAHNFEYNDLYVTMELELPKRGAWSLEDEEEDNMIVTQLCRTKSTHESNIAHFSCPFEFQLLQHNKPDTHGYPRFLIEVASLDFWDRHKIEGYGHFNLPSSPGDHNVLVNTWRPTGRRLIDKMRRFFIGGGPELEELSYIAQPRDFSGTHLAKYGFHTESSGNVCIKLGLVHQSSRTLDKARADQLAKSLKYKGLSSTTVGVLDAYRRARQKALQVTGGTL